jgi:protein-tyrosine phosphatase
MTNQTIMDTQPLQQPAAVVKRSARRVILILAVVAALAIALTITLYKSRHHVFPKRFAEVVPGHLYRAGQMKPWPMQRTLDQYKIRTIVNMMYATEDAPWQAIERQQADERGIEIVRIPMNSNGCGSFDDLEKAADILQGNPVDGKVYPHPVLLHCAAGVCRTGSSYAVWRMKFHGWDADRAIAEARKHGKIDKQMVPHLKLFYEERIVGKKQPQANGQ